MAMNPNDFVVSDLAKSGLVQADFYTRELGHGERGSCNVASMAQGYVIPYYELRGRMDGFYRIRLQDHEPKYKQPRNEPNHVYFPRSFLETQRGKDYVVITEGEKKAARGCKAGIPCVALSGVDSWRNRILTLPKETALTAGDNGVKAKLPPSETGDEDITSTLAKGFQDLIDFILMHKLKVIIIFDSDQEIGIKADVQRAAATLGYELRFRGIPFINIRQLILPPIHEESYTDSKVGLDDYLQSQGKEKVLQLIQRTLTKRSAFPRHPSIRDYINKRLSMTKLGRKEIQNVSLAVLSDLDANGMRLRATTQSTYYFDNATKKLLRSAFTPNANNDQQYDAPFTQYLYQKFGLSGNDNRLLVWLGTQFTSEAPIDEVQPYKIFGPRKADEVTYQISDSRYAKVSAQGLTFHDNGQAQILFESDQCEPLDEGRLKGSFEEQQKQSLKCWWGDTLLEARLRDQEKQRVLIALLYYMSPWLNRWRGIQLPVEMIIGEAGSGKSTLCELRLGIITGRPHLRNCPQDLKDWHASITNTGGLHITDNVQLVDKNLKQRLSDEICRIITEPDPTVEQRKYYTNADLIRMPVRSTFALTAINQPFQNTDLVQRSIILELDKAKAGADISYDSEWKSQQLNRFGGRESWVAHHLLVLHRFFQSVTKDWRPNYQAKHRLIHLEQTLCLMAKVFGFSADWIPPFLTTQSDKALAENDWALEGIRAFAKQLNGRQVCTATNISEFAMEQEEYEKCEMLINARRLGRYMKQNKSLILQLAGLAEDVPVGNRQGYRLVRRPKEL